MTNDLILQNPDLLQFLKVHLTTIALLKDYLGLTQVKGKGWKKKSVRRKKTVNFK